MYKALLFDLDGVLLDTERMAFEIWREYLRGLDYELTLEQYAAICGGPPEEFGKFIDCTLPGDPAAFRENWFSQVARRTREGAVPKVKGYDNLFAYLAHYPGKTAIVSNNGGPWMPGYMEVFRFPELFDDIFLGPRVERRKPAPDIYLLACRTLGLEPRDCLAVEDSATGITAALAAGVPVLHMEGVGPISPELEAQCVARVRDLDGVVAFLEQAKA